MTVILSEIDFSRCGDAGWLTIADLEQSLFSIDERTIQLIDEPENFLHFQYKSIKSQLRDTRFLIESVKKNKEDSLTVLVKRLLKSRGYTEPAYDKFSAYGQQILLKEEALIRLKRRVIFLFRSLLKANRVLKDNKIFNQYVILKVREAVERTFYGSVCVFAKIVESNHNDKAKGELQWQQVFA